MRMTNVIGPDVSFYQDDPVTPAGIHFEKMRAAAEFVIIRAGQNQWPDPDFKLNWKESKNAGLKRGCYWFYDSRAHPKRQAEIWYSLLEGDMGELPLFADFEEKFGGEFAGWGKWTIFLERIKQLTGGREIGIYTGYYYWRDHAPNPITQVKNLEYFHQYPLWIAHYQTPKPKVPKPWLADEWTFWQFTETGSGAQYGVESNAIDLNYFNGTQEVFQARFPSDPTNFPPIPLPQAGPGTTHQVIPSVLRVREGPGTSYKIIGRLKRDDLVEEITANTDRSWIKIKCVDGLIGWASNDYLLVEEVKPPAKPPPPPPPTGKKYRVYLPLKLHEGPGNAYPTLAMLQSGDIVEELGATKDEAWLQVKSASGQIGWVRRDDLFSDHLPIPPQPTPPPPPVVDWYQVKATALTARDAPSPAGKTIGYFSSDDILQALDFSADGTWVKLQRIDGLQAWAHGKYLKLLGDVQPRTLRQKIFTGITYFRKIYDTPRSILAHVLTIDLRAARYNFLVTPSEASNEMICTKTVSAFLEEYGMDIAINGDGFSYIDPPPANQPCSKGEPVFTNGLAASRGSIYSQRGGPTVYINRNNNISFKKPIGNIYNAVSGDRMILEKGKLAANLAVNTPNPRTAIGVSGDSRTLILAVVDGKQPGLSEGITYSELADLLSSFGGYTGISMDGGGSSTLAIRGVDGKARVINSPIDANIPGKERAVANHLGIALRRPS